VVRLGVKVHDRVEAISLDETDAMTLYIALNRIREEQDPTLMFDFVCRAGICGSCAMMINARPEPAWDARAQDGLLAGEAPVCQAHPEQEIGMRNERGRA
jgi:succinate dehydrogenase/fumarate reductase-like Fe-S protein